MNFSHNIYDFLGTGKAKYHSCFITTFAFDFSYFNMESVPAIRRTGAKNILVLVDESYLDYLLDQPVLRDSPNELRFGIQSIYSKGFFHPKLILLLGEKEGFLAVGSGNQTAAGQGMNRELWSVFHYKGKSSPNANIFSQAIEYIQELSATFVGFSLDKWERAKVFTPWLKELPKASLNTLYVYEGEQLGLFSSNKAITENLENIIKEEPVKNIIVLSPYYDRNGRFLQELQKKFQPKSFKVVMDISNKLLPFDLNDGNIKFINWAKACLSEDKIFRRLHAKIICFQLNNGSEIIVTGSSNSTVAAMGLTGHSIPSNQELNIITIRRNGNIFKELGIKISDHFIMDLPEREEELNHEISGIKKNRHLIRIIDLVKTGEGWDVIVEQNFDLPLNAVFESRGQEVLCIKKLNFIETKSHIQIDNGTNDPFCFYFLNENGFRISNKFVIQDEMFHHQSSPDPDQAELEAQIAELENGDYAALEKILSYVRFDSQLKSKASVGIVSSDRSQTAVKTNKADYKILNQEDFKSDKNYRYRHSFLNSGNFKIVEVLRMIAKKQFKISDRSLEEEAVDVNTDKGDDPHESPSKDQKKIHKYLPHLKRAKDAFIRKYIQYISLELLAIIKTEARYDVVKKEVDIHELSNIVIVLRLIRLFLHNKDFSLTKQNGNIEYFNSIYGEDPEDAVNIFVIEALSKFSLLYQFGTVQLKDELANRKMKELEEDFLNLSIYCICNPYWIKNVRETFHVILLNLFKGYLLSNPQFTLSDLKQSFGAFRKEKLISTNGEEKQYFESDKFQENLEYVYNILFPSLINFVNQVGNRSKETIKISTSLSHGDIIYFSALGFVIVVNIYSKSIQTHLVKIVFPPAFGSEKNDQWVIRNETANQVLKITI